MMPNDKNSPIVLINTFRLKAADQAKLIALFVKVTEDSVTAVPGFGGATLHRSLDGTRVVMYARWQSLEHYEAMRARSGSTNALEEIAQIATFEPGAFTIEYEFHPSDS